MIRVNVENKFNCNGCSACNGKCSTKCISMQKDKMGFLYPVIDIDKCKNCGLCSKICPELNDSLIKKNKTLETYAAISLDTNLQLNSSSGGIFPLLAQYVISQNGIVVGAAFSHDFCSVKHICVNSLEDLHKLYGSKYVQSNMNNCFEKVKYYLENGKMVLFSGTPCQVAGLQAFISKDYENLILVDIVCHGVPSPEVWSDYVKYLEKKNSGKVIAVSFRNKEKGWEKYALNIEFDNGKRYLQDHRNDLYMRGYLHNYYLRPSCYRCKYKGVDRIADITLGDLWGAQQIDFELFDEKGVSLVNVSSNKGKLILDSINEKIKSNPISFDKAIQYNLSIVKSIEQNSSAAIFERNFKTISINKLLAKFCSVSLLKKVKNKVKRIIYKT